MLLVSVAGPLANILVAFVCAGGAALMWHHAQVSGIAEGSTAHFLLRMFVVGTLSNFALAWINLVPIPPLDGSHIVEAFLPRRWAWQYSRLGRWGFIILIVLLATGVLARSSGRSSSGRLNSPSPSSTCSEPVSPIIFRRYLSWQRNVLYPA